MSVDLPRYPALSQYRRTIAGSRSELVCGDPQGAVERSIQWIGDERKGIVHSRRHFAASPAFKGLFNFRQTRIALLRAETKQEVFAIMDDIVNLFAPTQSPV